VQSSSYRCRRGASRSLHALWTDPEGDHDYPMRRALIKADSLRRIPSSEPFSKSPMAKGEQGISQCGTREHLIRDDSDYENHVDTIPYNPVKQGHATLASDRPYSSIQRTIAAGILQWNGGGAERIEHVHPLSSAPEREKWCAKPI
jgi:putative transposase